MTHAREIEAILKQVARWPEEERRYLALRLATKGVIRNGKRRSSLGDLRGIGNPSGTQLTDEEVARLRLDATREKYGI
jgi:hypothetical protein